MNLNVSSKNYPIEQVHISNLKNYLKDRGWIEESYGREEVFKFKSPRPLYESKYIEVLIPSQEDLIDYNRIVEIAIDTISAFEKRNLEDVLSQVLSFGDLLKFQISTSKTKTGNIPIDDGITLYKSISDLLIYSACAEISLQKSYLRKLKGAVTFIENCQIGQSQYGSFVANIHCLLKRPRYLNREANRNFTPLGRKTVLRILRGISNIKDSIQENTPEPIINNYDEGLNANMCDTLIDIIDIGHSSDINISTSLEPVWEIPENIITDLSITPYARAYLMEASDKLRGENPEEKRKLEGYVYQLTRRPDEEENTIRLLAFDEEKEALPVIIKLDAESYNLAIKAHEKSNLIRITGILKKDGRRWILDNIEGLSIINDS